MAEDIKEESVVSTVESDQATPDRTLNNAMLIEGACLLRRMEICVAEAEKRSGKNAVSMQETFTVYLVETRPMDAIAEGRNPPPDSLWRRYSEFELLRNYLIVTYPYIVVPPLPEKRVSSAWLLLTLK
ncbi:intercellular trafficking and secretion [Ilyodon furcidens]|uniref:Intercellular trafficking and secretion n=1 Tax=Ilyodon furcidens TaxID=33524 RepID=A0ABV0SKH7_9TELE